MKKRVKRCPNCNSINPLWQEQCLMCEADLTLVSPTEIESVNESEASAADVVSTVKSSSGNVSYYEKPISNSGSHLAKNLIIAICIVGFIVSIVLGNVFSTPAEHYYEKDKFNFIVMFVTWICTAAYTLPYVLMYYHFKNQETTNEILSAIDKKLN